ncbi:MAG: 23S rRNA (adenine(2030)-N(6))-methyltransferase RlmJ, partial [Pseudorhodoplanes sp.]
MNYRHAFHAGNFADVIKHTILSRIVAHLRKKESAFRVIDTHAGAGLYDLTGPEAVRNPEWRDGIGRLFDAEPDPAAHELLRDYLDAVRSANPDGKIGRYPGSPALVRSWLRHTDRLVACELEPSAAAALSRNFHGDRRVKIITIDGWTALSAYIPPKERRGLVLIDPPYERTDEFSQLAGALKAAFHKWPTGIFFAWYPIKDVRANAAFERDLRASGMTNMLRADVTLSPLPNGEKLRGGGHLIVNPPWTLEQDLKILLP